jgi:hypothetical protein
MREGPRDTAPKPAGRFVKGKSGNPTGRPRKTKPPAEARASAFDIVTSLTLPMVQDGVMREVTLQEALTLKTYQDALKGSHLARKKIIKMIQDRDALRATQQKSSTFLARKIDYRTMSVDPDTADAAMLILDIARHNPARAEFTSDRAQLLLEPWAVQAALGRRRSTVALAPRDISEITRCTRESASLNWPRGSRD